MGLNKSLNLKLIAKRQKNRKNTTLILSADHNTSNCSFKNVPDDDYDLKLISYKYELVKKQININSDSPKEIPIDIQVKLK